MNNDTINNAFWNIRSIDLNQISLEISTNADGFTWNLFKKKVQKYLGKNSGEGLKSIEIGCGLGKFSLQMALWGGQPTLLDLNLYALKHARELYNHFGISANIIKEDALNIPEELNDNYDIVVSFGFAEHFVGKEREKIIQNHVNLLRKGGLCFLQVPNALSPCYRIAFGMRKKLGLWPKNITEIPYTVYELKRIASKAGLDHIDIMSTQSIVTDFDYWFMNNIKSLFKKFGLYQFPKKWMKHPSKEHLQNSLNANRDIRLTQLSKKLTYPLLLTGIRK